MARGRPTVFVVHGGEVEQRTVEVGLDNNRMIRIAANLEPGERVLLAPPEPSEDVEEEALENDTFVEATELSSSAPAAAPQQERGRDRYGAAGMSPEQREEMRKRYENMSPEERERMRGGMGGGGGMRGGMGGGGGMRGGMGGGGGMGNMSPDQMEEMRKRYENMTPEDRERMREQMRGGGGGNWGGQGGSAAPNH